MRFSIIIPTYNRPQRLARCLASIAVLDYPREQFEVIVVDDGSELPVEGAAHSVAMLVNLTVLRQKNAGPASARNFGASAAQGELLAFLDDDCAPHYDWLQQMDLAARRDPGCLWGGRTINACRDNIFAETNQKLLDAVAAWFTRHKSPLQFFASNNFVVPSTEFHQIGGFDATFPLAGGEDRDFCARWLSSGRRLVPAPSACIDHFHPQTVRSYLNMHYRYGRGAARLHRLRGSSPLRFAKKGLYGHLLFTFAKGGRPLMTCSLFALSQLATATGFFQEARDKSD
jgi:glycosyltransferase involved in cell wall biosynthesis